MDAEKRTSRASRTAIRDELEDSFDEELEMELDDERLARLLGRAWPTQPRRGRVDRRALLPRAVPPAARAGQAAGLGGRTRSSRWWCSSRAATPPARAASSSAITQRLNPRVCRVAALPAPSERERTQWYFQRYVAHLPAAGEIVLFDRSWYNRAGVERVMGFCSEDDVEEFFRTVPEFERMLVRSGIILIKYWFSITDEEQHLRFMMRIHDPLKQWKLSPMDLESRRRWEEYTKAKEAMLERTHIPEAPWWVVEATTRSGRG